MAESTITLCDFYKHHKMKVSTVPFVMQIRRMGDDSENPFFEQGRRLRWLRQAERIPTGTAFAVKIGWAQSGYSQFETGKRQITREKALQLSRTIPGFDPFWLWDGDKRGLSFDLRQRIEAEEAKEAKADIDPLASSER
jgi:hypothetical protein